MQRKLKCLYVEENSLPKEIEISNSLRAKQEMVKGSIEYTRLLEDEDVVLICNEEGKINGMAPNRDVGYDIIFGPFLIVAENSEDGEDRSLTEEQISKYKKIFGKESIDRTMAKYEAMRMSRLNNYEL